MSNTVFTVQLEETPSVERTPTQMLDLVRVRLRPAKSFVLPRSVNWYWACLGGIKH